MLGTCYNTLMDPTQNSEQQLVKPTPKQEDMIAQQISATGPYAQTSQQSTPPSYDGAGDNRNTEGGYSLDESSDFNQNNQDVLSWDTQAFTHTGKTSTWYGAFGMGVLLASIAIYLITKDIATVIAIIVVSILFAVGLSRRPSVVKYSVGASGFTIGGKRYPYSQFRSFSVVYERTANTLILTPLKRFMLPIVLNYPSEIEEDLVEIIAVRLPFTEKPGDALDQVTRQAR